MDDQSADLTTATVTDDAPVSEADGSAPASSALTDEHHDWASSFCGINTKASDAGGSSDSGGGLLSGIADAAASLAGSVSGVVDTVVADATNTVTQAVDSASDAALRTEGVLGNEVKVAAQAEDRLVASVASAAGKVEKAVKDAGSLGVLADRTVQGVIDADASGARALLDEAPLPDSVKQVGDDVVTFEKGVAEGGYSAAKGMLTGAEAAVSLIDGKDLVDGVVGLSLATAGSSAGDGMLKEVEGDLATDMGAVDFTAKMLNPVGQVELGAQVVGGYQQAAAAGQGLEYIGKGVGVAAVTVLTVALGGEGGKPGEPPPGGGDPPGGGNPPGGGDPPGGGGKGGGGDPPGGGDDPPSDDGDPPQPKKRLSAKELRAKQQAEAAARKSGKPPAEDPQPDEKKQDHPEVGQKKVPLDVALDAAGIEMEPGERDRFGEWVIEEHGPGPHEHYDLSPESLEQLRRDVADFRGQ